MPRRAGLSDAHALPLQWNGTSGIFAPPRLRAKAGGWLASRATSVLTEIWMSYRALLAGYRGRHMSAIAVPSELPAAMAVPRSSSSAGSAEYQSCAAQFGVVARRAARSQLVTLCHWPATRGSALSGAVALVAAVCCCRCCGWGMGWA